MRHKTMENGKTYYAEIYYVFNRSSLLLKGVA